MRVAFVPNWRANPYLELLEEALGQEIEVIAPVPPAPYTSWVTKSRAPFDVLHVHWPEGLYQTRSALAAWRRVVLLLPELLAARSAGCRIVWTMHNLYSHDHRYPVLDWIVWKMLASLSNAVIVHCAHAADVLRQRFWRRRDVYVVALGNYIGVHGPCVDRCCARERLGIPEVATVFLHIGLLRPYKGIAELITAYSLVDSSTALLLIAGRSRASAYGQRVVDLADSVGRVRCELGWISDEDVATYLGACDFVVLPYLRVLTSSSVVLAMSYRRPVIAPHRGCLPEYIGTEAGILYDGDDAHGLARALERGTQASPRLLHQMSMYAYRKVQNWTWASVAEVTTRAYRGEL